MQKRLHTIRAYARRTGRNWATHLRMFGKAVLLAWLVSPFLAIVFFVYLSANLFSLTWQSRELAQSILSLLAALFALCAFSSLSVSLTFPLVAFVRPFKIRREREPAHLCRQCRYDMSGVETGVCPECGNMHDVAANESRLWLSRRVFNVWRFPIVAFVLLGYCGMVVIGFTFEPDIYDYRTPFEQAINRVWLALIPIGMLWLYWMYEGAMLKEEELA